MDDINAKIIELLDAVYNLSDVDREKLRWSIQGLTDEEKKEILVEVFKRYEAFEENIKKLTSDMQHIVNDADEIIEHNSADKVLLELE